MDSGVPLKVGIASWYQAQVCVRNRPPGVEALGQQGNQGEQPQQHERGAGHVAQLALGFHPQMNAHLNAGHFQRPALGIGQHNDGRLDDLGKVTLHQGPLVYCTEWADNDGKTSNLIVPAGTAFTPVGKPQLFNSSPPSRPPCRRYALMRLLNAATGGISTTHAHGLPGNSVA